MTKFKIALGTALVIFAAWCYGEYLQRVDERRFTRDPIGDF